MQCIDALWSKLFHSVGISTFTVVTTGSTWLKYLKAKKTRIFHDKFARRKRIKVSLPLFTNKQTISLTQGKVTAFNSSVKSNEKTADLEYIVSTGYKTYILLWKMLQSYLKLIHSFINLFFVPWFELELEDADFVSNSIEQQSRRSLLPVPFLKLAYSLQVKLFHGMEHSRKNRNYMSRQHFSKL